MMNFAHGNNKLLKEGFSAQNIVPPITGDNAIEMKADGSWLCPVCRHKNEPHTLFCRVCGKDL